MRTLFTTLAVALFITAANAETLAERRWRLRAEILERQLELVQMELREKEGASTEPASTKDFVDAYGTRFASLETDRMQLASLKQNRSSSVEDSPEASKTETKKTKPKSKDSSTEDNTSADKKEPPSDPRPWPEYHTGEFGYQILKPSTRIFFDTGSDDTGELDIFKDGHIAVSVDFLTISYDFALSENVTIGAFVAGGISSSTSEADRSAILMWSTGIALNVRDMPFSFEAGILQGISASETLSDHTDTALFVGISLTNPVPKKRLGPKE